MSPSHDVFDAETLKQMMTVQPHDSVIADWFFREPDPDQFADVYVFEDPDVTRRAENEVMIADSPEHMTVFLAWLLACCTGGRPMRRLDGPPGFVESLSGARMVHHRQDLFGRVWLAEDRWSWFRIPVE